MQIFWPAESNNYRRAKTRHSRILFHRKPETTKTTAIVDQTDTEKTEKTTKKPEVTPPEENDPPEIKTTTSKPTTQKQTTEETTTTKVTTIKSSIKPDDPPPSRTIQRPKLPDDDADNHSDIQSLLIMLIFGMETSRVNQ